MPLRTPDPALRVLVAGGGVAAVEAALALREQAPGAAVTLVAAAPAITYRPMSVLQPFGTPAAGSVPLARLREFGVQVVEDRVVAVDPVERRVLTATDAELPYDALVMALGARPRRAFEHALTFRGPEDADAVLRLVQDVEAGRARRIAFAVPEGVTWTLPLYEMALQFAGRVRSLGLERVELLLATPERRPLEVFGRAGAALVETLLEEAGIEIHTGVRPAVPSPGTIEVDADGPRRVVDRVIALPVLAGRPVHGIPTDPAGFIPVDAHGRVTGAAHVYAAGDATDRPVKQGGLAAQQAGTAAVALLADHGAGVGAAPAAPLLRGMLVAGAETWYLRRADDDPNGEVSRRPLWWPARKVAGERLAPFLDAVDAGGPERRLSAPHGLRRRAIISRGAAGHAAVTRL